MRKEVSVVTKDLWESCCVQGFKHLKQKWSNGFCILFENICSLANVIGLPGFLCIFCQAVLNRGFQTIIADACMPQFGSKSVSTSGCLHIFSVCAQHLRRYFWVANQYGVQCFYVWPTNQPTHQPTHTPPTVPVEFPSLGRSFFFTSGRMECQVTFPHLGGRAGDLMSKAEPPKREEIWEICQGSCCLKLSCRESVGFRSSNEARF